MIFRGGGGWIETPNNLFGQNYRSSVYLARWNGQGNVFVGGCIGGEHE